MKRLTGILTDHSQADVTVTYSLISADGENIQYQHNSNPGISIFLENTSHFVPIPWYSWYSKLSILDTEQQIYFSILPPYRPRKGDDQSYSGKSEVIKLKYTMVEKPKLSKFQTVQYLFGQKIWSFLRFNL